MGRRHTFYPLLIEIMKPTPPKHIINTHATINHTHHGVSEDTLVDVTAREGGLPDETLVGVIGREGEPPVGAPEIFDPPEASWIIFPGSFLYENTEVPEELV